jgi:hypothetical protein
VWRLNAGFAVCAPGPFCTFTFSAREERPGTQANAPKVILLCTNSKTKLLVASVTDSPRTMGEVKKNPFELTFKSQDSCERPRPDDR